MKTFNDDNMCFVCGTGNNSGLKLDFQYDEENDRVIAETSFPNHFQGWMGVLHGGIVSTVLDEVMVKAAGQKGFRTVTAELNVRFKKPAKLENSFLIWGKVTGSRGRVVTCEASIQDQNGTIAATAAGKFMHMPG